MPFFISSVNGIGIFTFEIFDSKLNEYDILSEGFTSLEGALRDTCSLSWGYNCLCCCFVGVEVCFVGAAGCLAATSFFFLREASNDFGAAVLDLKL
jgi:hypothetical protein